MSKLRYVILDVLKPHEPSIYELANEISKLSPSFTVNIKSIERDEHTETIQIMIQGDNINLEAVRKKINALGATIHSIDKVCVGKRLVKVQE